MAKRSLKSGTTIYKKYTGEQLSLMKTLVTEEGMTAPRMLKTYPSMQWGKRTLERLVAKIKRGEELVAGRAAGGGRKMKDPGLLQQARDLKNADGQTISAGIKPLARKLGCSRKQARTVVKKLGLKSVPKVRGRRMSQKNKEDRLSFSEHALKRMARKRDPLLLRTIWFSDEKIFTAAPRSQGTRKDRVLIPSNMKKSEVDGSVIVRGVANHGLSQMVGWRVGQQGRLMPYFLPKKTFIGGKLYREQMLSHYYPQIAIAASGKQEPFVFMQDKATPHGTPENTRWLGQNMKGWLKHWPNKGADMDPLDYAIWSNIQEKVWSDECKNQLQLNTSILKLLSEYPQSEIDKAISSFTKKVSTRRSVQGGYFEHTLEKKGKKEKKE